MRQIIKELYGKIKELGKDQREAAGQSTENFGHDDAVQEVVFQDRRVVLARLKNLQDLVNNAVVISPNVSYSRVQMGAIVRLSDNRVVRIGSFMVFAEHQIANISYNSPLGKALLNKEIGDEIEFRGKFFSIVSIK